MTIRRALAGWLLLTALGATGCSRHPHPLPPPALPTAMPSEVEAGRVRPGAGEAIPRPAATSGGAITSSVGGTVSAAPRIYRVQLMATADGALAQRRAEEFRRVFDQPVRVDAEGGLFKIRVGACSERGAAEALQRQALAAGVRDAFVMEADDPAR